MGLNEAVDGDVAQQRLYEDANWQRRWGYVDRAR